MYLLCFKRNGLSRVISQHSPAFTCFITIARHYTQLSLLETRRKNPKLAFGNQDLCSFICRLLTNQLTLTSRPVCFSAALYLLSPKSSFSYFQRPCKGHVGCGTSESREVRCHATGSIAALGRERLRPCGLIVAHHSVANHLGLIIPRRRDQDVLMSNFRAKT